MNKMKNTLKLSGLIEIVAILIYIATAYFFFKTLMGSTSYLLVALGLLVSGLLTSFISTCYKEIAKECISLRKEVNELKGIDNKNTNI